MKLKKGILIVIEGIDGAGKTTQVQILREKLQAHGLEVASFREPSDSKWGIKIKKKAALPDSLSPEEELELFQKDRKDNVKKNLKPALKQKKTVLLDRYYFSTIAYQGAKGIDPKRIQRMNEKIAVKPDLVFILNLKPKKGLKRIEDREQKDLLFEREDYLEKVREIFSAIKGPYITHINAERSKEEIAEEIERTVFEYLNTIRTDSRQ